MSIRPFNLLILIAVAIGAGYALAQWGTQSALAVAGSSGAAVDLKGPVPRTPDGKPDLSGVWQTESLPREIGLKLLPGGVDGAQTLGEAVPPRHFMNVMWDLKPDEVVMSPAAKATFEERGATMGRDMPSSFCLPLGVPLMDGSVTPFKVVQLPGLVTILYEEPTTFRQIFTDGRSLPADPEPAFLGHSVGRWDGDTLVVDASGFRDGGWLDAFGHPHSSGMRVTERFARKDVGTMEVQVMVNDPMTYDKPFTYSFVTRLQPNAELIEAFCENEKFRGWVARQAATALPSR